MTSPAQPSRFTITPLSIPGVCAVRRHRMGDARGSLTRVFCPDELAAAGWQWPVAQVNHSHTRQAGTVRGMHYQRPPCAEAKLVTCLRGRAWDVALDLRAGSPTFLRWCAQEISADNQVALLIPPGCAHGFQTLSDDVELLYLHSAAYEPLADAGVNPQDPLLGITWPEPITVMSDKDAQRPLLDSSFTGLQP
jgi:dTDP-4-dehydrorhamnose 3,5-epimerase